MSADPVEAVREALNLLHGPNEPMYQPKEIRAHAALSAITAELKETKTALKYLLLEVDDVERTDVIRESDIYTFARSVLAAQSEEE